MYRLFRMASIFLTCQLFDTFGMFFEPRESRYWEIVGQFLPSQQDRESASNQGAADFASGLSGQSKAIALANDPGQDCASGYQN
jgi:hypothetical protein